MGTYFWIISSDYNSPSIVSVIQEIVNQGTWASGNAIAIIITGSGHRPASSYDGDAANAPNLLLPIQLCQHQLNSFLLMPKLGIMLFCLIGELLLKLTIMDLKLSVLSILKLGIRLDLLMVMATAIHLRNILLKIRSFQIIRISTD